MYIIFISYVGMFPHTGCYWEVKVLEDSEFNMKARESRSARWIPLNVLLVVAGWACPWPDS